MTPTKVNYNLFLAGNFEWNTRYVCIKWPAACYSVDNDRRH